MPKYYVESGDLKKIINAHSHKLAAINAFKTIDSSTKKLGKLTFVGEQGFTNHKEDIYLSTSFLLEESKLIENFKIKDWI